MDNNITQILKTVRIGHYNFEKIWCIQKNHLQKGKAFALDTSTSGTTTRLILSNLLQLSCDSATDLYLLISVIIVSFHYL